MNRKLYTLTLTATLGLFLFSCKTAKKMYEKGNYDEAVELAAKKLQKTPNDPELLNIIQNAYDYALNDHEDRIDGYMASSSDLKYERIYNEYLSLQKMYDAIYRVPEVYKIVSPVNYSSQISTYAQKAGDARYNRGMAFMQQNTKSGYKNAYREFQAVLRFIPGDVEATNMMYEAYEYAVTNIIILPMQQNGGYMYSSYTIGGNNLDDRILQQLQYGSSGEFVKFYSAWEARSRNIRIDQQVELSLVNVDIGRYYDTRITQKVSKEVVVKETVYKKDSVVKEYARVYADITTTRRTLNSNAILQVTVRDYNGRRLWTENVNGDHIWSTDFATYSGDERALSDSDKQLINRRGDLRPNENEIMQQLIEDLTRNTQYRLRNYFAGM